MLLADVMEGTTVTRVLLVNDRERISDALEALGRVADVCLLGGVPTLEDAVALLEEPGSAPVDVVVIDLDGLADPDAAGATRTLRDVAPGAKVVIRASDEDPEVIAGALAAGACGFVAGSLVPDDLVDVVRRAAGGELLLPERHLAAVLDRLQRARGRSMDDAVLDRLTPRETQILRSLAGGRTVTEIAATLDISALTVQTHVKSILAKLGVHSKIEAVTLAWRHGLAPSARSA